MVATMTFDPNNVSDFDIMGAVEQAVTLGWLTSVDHGYCFYCGTEKSVYDVTMDNAPVQPPRCGDCYVAQAQAVLADPAAVARLIDDCDYGAS
jgi:hypothetical protein